MLQAAWMRSWSTLCAFALAGVAGCGGGDQAPSDPGRESPLGLHALGSLTDPPCSNCVFGPRLFVRDNGRPRAESAEVAGDPDADYVVDIDDRGAQGADGSVTLDGVVLLPPRSGNYEVPRHVALNTKLLASSKLTVRLTGKPGSSLSIAIRSGAKVLGPGGGAVTNPGGGVTLQIPPGALTSPTMISIARPVESPPPGYLGGWAVDIGPSGTVFDLPVTLRVKYDPTLLPEGWADSLLTLALASNGSWVDISTVVDAESKTLSAQLSHLSTYAYKQFDPTTMTNPIHLWSALPDPAKPKSTRCWISEDPDYNASLGELAKLLFGLETAPTTGVGCVTEPYLGDGYSKTFQHNENHAGIDFRAKDASENGVPVFAISDGKVEFENLNLSAGQSTLTIRSTINGKPYRLLYLHCKEHKWMRDGKSPGELKADVDVLKGDQVCMSGSVGATAIHLHFEVKAVGMDGDKTSAISGGPNHCTNLGFYGYNLSTNRFDMLTSPGCPLSYIGSNTVDPTVLLKPASARILKWVDYPGATATELFGINRFGQAVGAATIGGKTLGFLFSGSGFLVLPTPPNGNSYFATGITENGLIVGNTCPYGDCFTTGGLDSGFIFEGGIYTTFNVPGALQTNIRGISSNGRYLAGDRLIPVPGGGTTNVGWAYDRATGKFTYIGGGSDSVIVAQGVNNSGQVVGNGVFDPSTTRRGFLADLVMGTRETLSIAGVGDTNVIPRAVNNLGSSGGGIGGLARAYYHTGLDVSFVDLPGGGQGFVYGGNDAGQWVGFAVDSAGRVRGFILE